MSHQYDQQFEQKYENKREKSGSKVENSLELMLSQCCESSLTCSSPPSCREKRGETRADREKSLQKRVVANEPSRGENAGKRDGGALESSVSCLYRTHSGPSRPGKTASTRPIGQIPRGGKSRSTHTSSPTVIGDSC